MKRIFLAFVTSACAVCAQPYDIALITMDKNDNHWKAVNAGATRAQNELKAQGTVVNVIWDAPAANEIEAQKAIVGAMVQRHVHAIAIAPIDALALVEPMSRASAANIPYVIIDSGLKSTQQISVIHTDNYKAGVLAAKRLAALLNRKGNVILFRAHKGPVSTGLREEGFLSVIKTQYPEIKIVDDPYGGTSYAAAEATARALLAKVGNQIDGVFASNEMSAVGMLAALRAAKLGGKVKFIGFDVSPQMLDGLKSGDLQGFVMQNPEQMGYTAVKTLVAHLKGAAVEPEVDTGCVMVTSENVKEAGLTAQAR